MSCYADAMIFLLWKAATDNFCLKFDRFPTHLRK
jgi:hypothetical protein